MNTKPIRLDNMDFIQMLRDNDGRIISKPGEIIVVETALVNGLSDGLNSLHLENIIFDEGATFVRFEDASIHLKYCITNGDLRFYSCSKSTIELYRSPAIRLQFYQ